MTRQHAALKLLVHGPLRFGQFVSITGWPEADCQAVLIELQAAKRVRFSGVYHDLYSLC